MDREAYPQGKGGRGKVPHRGMGAKAVTERFQLQIKKVFPVPKGGFDCLSFNKTFISVHLR
jgi:hypothetical protein